MAKSEAAKEVKLGFFVAVGFWVFGIIAAVILVFVLMALGKRS
jgi:acyl dehydratase